VLVPCLFEKVFGGEKGWAARRSTSSTASSLPIGQAGGRRGSRCGGGVEFDARSPEEFACVRRAAAGQRAYPQDQLGEMERLVR